MFLKHLSHRPRRSIIALAAAAAAALALTGCSGGSGSGGGGSSAGTSITVFNGATGSVSENFNPFISSALQPTFGVIYETLDYYNLTSGKQTSQLATAHTWNSAGTQLTITTRSGVKWSDGKPFSAADVAYTVNLVHADPALNTNGITATAKATGTNTVVLTFPSQAFVQEASVLGNLPIVPEHLWKNIKNPTTNINKTPVGTGPYTLQSFSPQSYVLQSNASYWGGTPKIKNVRYIALSDADAASGALLAGQVDWMSSYLPGLKKLVANHKDISYVNNPINTTELAACSNAALGCKGPQTDTAVRQAIYYAVDRDQLNQLAEGGFGQVSSPTMLLPKRDRQWIVDPSLVTSPGSANVAKADSILQADGWTKGSDGIYVKNGQRLSMTLEVISGYSDYVAAASAMTTELKKAGIELKTDQVSVNQSANDSQNGSADFTISNFGASVSTNPYAMYNQYYSSKNVTKVGTPSTTGNTPRYVNPKVDAALAAAAATKDPAVQKQQFGIIESEISRDLPFIPLFVTPTITEFNTTHIGNLPTGSTPYAFPAAWKNWDNGIVLRHLTVKG